LAGPVLAAPSDDAPLPLFGFGLEDERPHALARRCEAGFKVRPPPGSVLERALDGRWVREPARPGKGTFVLRSGERVRLRRGQMTLRLSAAPAPHRPPLELWRSLPPLPLGLTAAMGVALFAFALWAPTRVDEA